MRNRLQLHLAAALCLTLGCAARQHSEAVRAAGTVGDTPRARAMHRFLTARLLSFRDLPRAAVPEYEAAAAADPSSPYLRLQLAAAYERTRQPDKAAAACREALRLAPSDHAAHLLMGRLLLAKGDQAGAEAALREAVRLRPTAEAAQLALAALYLEQKRADKALGTYEALVKAVPSSTVGLYRLARYYRERGQLRKAEQYYRRTVDLGRALRPLLELAYLYEEQNRRDDAIAAYREAYELAPQSADILVKLVELYLSVPDDTLANFYAAKLREDPSNSGRVRMRLGLIFHGANRFEAAAAELTEALRLSPDLHRARYYLGATFSALKDYARALTTLSSIPRGSDAYDDARTHMGFVHRETGRFDEAQKLLEEVVSSTPKNVVAHDLLASVLEKRGKLPEAVLALERAVTLLPSEERLYQTLAVYLERAGRFDDAVARMREVLARNPKSASALNFIGYSYADRGIHLDEAERLIRQALELRPNDGYITDSLGWVLFKRGRLDEALQTLEKARALAPKEAAVYEHLGDVLHKRGDAAKAREMYEEALRHKPDEKVRQQLQDKLRGLTGSAAPATAQR